MNRLPNITNANVNYDTVNRMLNSIRYCLHSAYGYLNQLI